MSAITRVLGGVAPHRSELISIGERMGYVEAMRGSLAALVVASVILLPAIVEVNVGAIIVVTLAYLGLTLIPHALRRLGKARVLPLLGATLLIDGVYCAWIVFATGGAVSPLRFLFLVHIVVVTLLMSSRTGLKIALWDTLLFVLVVSFRDVSATATATGNAPGIAPAVSAVDDGATLLTILAMWVVAIATATLSAIKERELRAQKADLEYLSAMMKEIDESSDASEMPAILLRHLQGAFGFSRGLVLASPKDDLDVMATTLEEDPPGLETGMDPLMERAWATREPQLVRRLDPASDPRLASLLPDAQNVLLVPLYLDHGDRLGFLVLEKAGTRDTMKRWAVALIEQFASHTALALHNAWLLATEQQHLEEIRSLQGELLAHNANLELTVLTRTEELRDAIQDLEEVDEQRRRLLSHVVQAQEEERVRIANDIHDDPVQKMVAAKMRLEFLRRSIDPDQLEAIDSIEQAVRTSIQSLRHLLFDLRPPILDEAGLGPAIQRFLDHADVPFEFVVDNGLEHEAPPETRVILYRIAQEALTNARKHSEASRVDVTLRHERGEILMTIADDGVGFSPQQAAAAAPGHLGLVAMRERAEMAGGRCDLRSLPSGGTTVEVSMPFEQAAAQPVADAPPVQPVADPAPEEWEFDVEQLLGGRSEAPKETTGIA